VSLLGLAIICAAMLVTVAGQAPEPLVAPEDASAAPLVGPPAMSVTPIQVTAEAGGAAPVVAFRAMETLPNLTDEQRQQIEKDFPDGKIPADDGGVSQQLAHIDYSQAAPTAACDASIGATPDPTDAHYWYWCWSTLLLQPTGNGIRFPCFFGWCYRARSFLFPFGYCFPGCPSPPPPG
jgi:hypothetical protein